MFSDHGLHTNALYRLFKVENYETEQLLPMLFISLSENAILSEDKMNNLREN